MVQTYCQYQFIYHYLLEKFSESKTDENNEKQSGEKAVQKKGNETVFGMEDEELESMTLDMINNQIDLDSSF